MKTDNRQRNCVGVVLQSPCATSSVNDCGMVRLLKQLIDVEDNCIADLAYKRLGAQRAELIRPSQWKARKSRMD